MSADDKPHEIVIIRRGGHGDHDEHHGGVWKIAFADFMTAMMAFFLVMWLISANDKTRASVARYFNPVRLVDATTQPRGLHDAKKDESGITASPDTKQPGDEKHEGKKSASPDAGATESPAQKEKRLESALRDNPLAALAEIAAAGQSARAGGPSKAASPVIGRRGGEAFRDPFAPTAPVPAARDAGAAEDDIAAEALARTISDPEAVPPVVAEKNAKAAAERAEADKSAAEANKNAGEPAKPADRVAAVEAAKLAARREAEAEAVLAAVKDTRRENAAGPKLEVRPTPEGIVLSLVDTADFSMFANGSSVPAPQVVAMMDRVAGVLKGKAGAVIVRGYTDSKPYRGKRYDNWHLSIDRAQVAHYMLVHGGLDDGRIARVEGYADRGAKPGVEATSPLNRRIEILLKDAG